MCTKYTINASAWATDMGYAIALKITDINFPDLVQIHLFVFCQSGPPKPTRPLTLNKEKNWYGLIDKERESSVLANLSKKVAHCTRVHVMWTFPF